MEKFIHNQNIRHYRTLLADPTLNEETRKVLQQLLDAEVEKDKSMSAPEKERQGSDRLSAK